ncbi:MAG: hypothetical protein ACPHK8_01490 [Thermoplasmatota archaeon]
MSDVTEALRRRNQGLDLRDSDRQALREYARAWNSNKGAMTLRFPTKEEHSLVKAAAEEAGIPITQWVLDAIDAKLSGRVMDKYRLESMLNQNERLQEDMAFMERSLRDERTRNRELEGQMQDLVNKLVDLT